MYTVYENVVLILSHSSFKAKCSLGYLAYQNNVFLDNFKSIMFLLSSLIAQLFHGTSQHFTNNVWNVSEYTLSLAFNSTADLNER